jgi:hypothetical protein
LYQQHRWIDVPADQRRRTIWGIATVWSTRRTGQHLFSFTGGAACVVGELADRWDGLAEDNRSRSCRVGPRSDLGARVIDHHTHFRLFAPRARSVELCVSDDV